MTSSFSWKLSRSQTLSTSWEPHETSLVDGDKLTPERFWKWVDMCKDEDDFGISDDESRAHAKPDSAHPCHHFELDPTCVFDQEEILGHGQLGTVAKMKIRGSDIVFACKTSTTARRVETLRKEACRLKNLDHEHIVKFIGTFTPPGKKNYLSLIMSPVGEQSLEEFLRGAKSTEHLAWMKGWFYCLASALCYLHNNQIRHEDIKPSNIIHRGDTIFFTDFGSATEFKSEITTSTESPAYGSPMYEAPEVLDKTKAHSSRSDIFSLGCLYAEMLTAIAKGQVHELHKFCDEQCANTKKPSGSFLYSSVVERLDLWFASLQPPIEVTIIWKDIVQLMLRENRKERPTAIQTLKLLQAGFIPLILANGRNRCNHKDLEEVLSDDLPLSSHLDQTLRDARHSIRRVDSVDENLQRLEQLHLLLGSGSPVTPDQQIFLSLGESLDNCFVDTFASQDSSSKSKEFLEIVLYYRLNLNAHGTSSFEHEISQETRARDVDTSWDASLWPVSSMLQAAAYWGHERSVNILLDNGADPNVGNDKNGTALHAAASQGHIPIVRTLLSAGADPTLACVKFGSCLYAASRQGHNLVASTLIDAGADVNQSSGKECPPIAAAVKYGHSEVVQTLLGAGADPNYRMKGMTSTSLLQRAAIWGYDDIVQILLQAGADPNAEERNSWHGTALIGAASTGNLSIIRILCDGGADMNVIDEKRGTALIAACKCRQLESVRMLIQMGADVNLDVAIHRTAHAVASRYNIPGIMRLLEEAGAQRIVESDISEVCFVDSEHGH